MDVCITNKYRQQSFLSLLVDYIGLSVRGNRNPRVLGTFATKVPRRRQSIKEYFLKQGDFSAIREGGTFCADKKYPKNRRRIVPSALCKKNFIESTAVVIRKLIALTPKNARQQRKMIRPFLQCFLQKLFQQTAITHFTAYLSYVKLCATDNWI